MVRFPGFVLTEHAVVVLRERQIHQEWGRMVLEHPRLRLPDPQDPALFHAVAPIPEREDRVLKVVYNGKTKPWRVVSAYFDRAWRGLI